MSQRIWNRWFLVVMSLFVASLLAYPGARTVWAMDEEPPLDVYTDSNNDGVADAIAQEYEAILAAEDMDAALARFDRRLGYSFEVRQLQREVYNLQMQLSQSTSQEEQAALYQRILALGEQLQADPKVNAVTSSFQTIAYGGGAPTAAPNWTLLRRGHIMFALPDKSWTAFLYTMKWSHAGMYDGNNLVHESNGDGVWLKGIARWKVTGKSIAYGNNNQKPLWDVANAMTWAKGRYGVNGTTPYNYDFVDKWTDAKLYCSQLVWKTNVRTGIDLDTNSSVYRSWFTARYGSALALVVPGPTVGMFE
jgi:hypothetical protein